MYSGRSHAGTPLHHVFLGIPAIRALCAQVLAFGAVLTLAFILPSLIGVSLTIAAAALVQGVVAAVLARIFRMATWWLLIQFVFPVALVTLGALQLPSSIYLVAFLLLLVLFWSTFRTQVPFYPSTAVVWGAVAELLPKGKRLRVIDIGSGFGGFVMYLAERHVESAVVGIELAPLPWLCSLFRGRLSGSAGRFVRGDYNDVDFGDFDVVFAYLSPAAMPALWRKATIEMRKGALLLSYEFVIPGVDADIVIHPSEHGPALHGWRIK